MTAELHLEHAKYALHQDAEDTQAASPSLVNRLPSLLRGVGATAVVAALVSFLLQRWGESNDLMRYLMLFGTTLLLTAGGWLSGNWLREPRGARTFLALALAAIPVNFTILAALLYSQAGFETAGGGLPEIASWQAVDLLLLLPVLLVASLSLTAVARLGLMGLARRSSAPLTRVLLVTNLLLLVPTRAELPVVLMALAGMGLVFGSLRTLRETDAALSTFEGLLVRTLLMVGPAVLLLRNLWLHGGGELLLLALGLVGFFGLRLLARSTAPQGRSRAVVDLLSLPPALYVAIALAGLTSGLNDLLAHLLFLTSYAGLSLLVARESDHPGFFRSQALLVLSLGTLVMLGDQGGPIAALLAVLIGSGIAAQGLASHSRLPLFLGVLDLLAGGLVLLGSLGQLIEFGNWITLASLGVLVIFMASLLERHGAALHRWLRGWAAQVSEVRSEGVG